MTIVDDVRHKLMGLKFKWSPRVLKKLDGWGIRRGGIHDDGG
jgi:hypothetical protein